MLFVNCSQEQLFDVCGLVHQQCHAAMNACIAISGDADKLDDLRSKACLRRAEAQAALGNHAAALEVWLCQLGVCKLH
jgi:hypothetical protein